MLGALDLRHSSGPSVLDTLQQIEQVLADPTTSAADHRDAIHTLNFINNRGCVGTSQ